MFQRRVANMQFTAFFYRKDGVGLANTDVLMDLHAVSTEALRELTLPLELQASQRHVNRPKNSSTAFRVT